jgi:DNA-binding CsgD family transcriptional regulator
MELNAKTANALLSALGLARNRGDGAAALAAAGIELPLIARGERGRARRALPDPTVFVLDRDLVVREAEGESVMRLPWVEDGLFVGRQLPDISEVPSPVRTMCVEHYSAALAGQRGRFDFTSYGHAYSVDAVPIHRDDGGVEGVLAIATPVGRYAAAAAACERTAERLDSWAAQTEQRADLYRVSGRRDQALAERQAAERARRAAGRARMNARRLRARDYASTGPPSLTPREAEVLSLASHGLTYGDIAEQLTISAGTVKTHLENIYAKLDVTDKAAAVAAALRHGLIE